MKSYTLIIPYYNAPNMLARQMQEIEQYPSQVNVIVVDDGSDIPAAVSERCALFRIIEDIPWNRGGARNLGAHVAETDWIVQVDIDHVLPAESARALLEFEPEDGKFYRFPRFRVGPADETRNKDEIPREQMFGQIRPHLDSYLCAKRDYWAAGGYDEDYSGCLGGGTPFMKLLAKQAKPDLVPACLHVHTRGSVVDASVSDLSRDTTEFKKRFARKGLVKAKNPMRFEWRRIQ